MLRVAQRKLGSGAGLQLADASKLLFGDSQFDLITTSLMIHELSPSLRESILQEMKRVLKPTGRIAIVYFHPARLKFPQGWFNKVFILISEFLAGQEHFCHYRYFMANGGIPALCGRHDLIIETERVISGGNMAIFIAHTANGDRD